MAMTATDIVAWWGGLSGLILSIIEIVRFIRERPGYSVEIEYDKRDDFFKVLPALRYTIKNTSDKTTTIIGISLYEWHKHPKKLFPERYKCFASGILDAQKRIDFPQKLEPGSYLEGRISADTIRDHARRSCKPLVLAFEDTRCKKPKEVSLKVPKDF